MIRLIPPRRRLFAWCLLMGAAGTVCALFAEGPETSPTRTTVRRSSQIDGFSGPSRTVDVASAESGIVALLHVRRGDQVQAGALIASLDSKLHDLVVELAAADLAASGELDAAQAEVNLRARRLAMLERLKADNHARAEEVDRAQAEHAVASANQQIIRDRKQLKAIELQRARLQAEKRRITAPITGIIVSLEKDEGEYVGPNDPIVAQLAVLDPLKVQFHVPHQEAVNFVRGEKVQVRFGDAQEAVAGTVDFVSPVSDPESGTIGVEILIPNPEGRLPMGQRCFLAR